MTVLQKKKKNTYVYKKNSSNDNFPVPRVHCVATKVHLNFFSSSSYCSGTWLQNDSCRRSSKKQNKLTVRFPLSEGQFEIEQHEQQPINHISYCAISRVLSATKEIREIRGAGKSQYDV